MYIDLSLDLDQVDQAAGVGLDETERSGEGEMLTKSSPHQGNLSRYAHPDCPLVVNL